MRMVHAKDNKTELPKFRITFYDHDNEKWWKKLSTIKPVENKDDQFG